MGRDAAAHIFLRLVSGKGPSEALLAKDSGLEALARGVARSVASMADHELQEACVDALYVLWRAWHKRGLKNLPGPPVEIALSQRRRSDVEPSRNPWAAKAAALREALHPALGGALAQTFEATQGAKERFQAVYERARREALLATRAEPRGGGEGARALPLSLKIKELLVHCPWLPREPETPVDFVEWVDCGDERLHVGVFDKRDRARMTQPKTPLSLCYADLVDVEIHGTGGPNLTFGVPYPHARKVLHHVTKSRRPPPDHDEPVRVRLWLHGGAREVAALRRAGAAFKPPVQPGGPSPEADDDGAALSQESHRSSVSFDAARGADFPDAPQSLPALRGAARRAPAGGGRHVAATFAMPGRGPPKPPRPPAPRKKPAAREPSPSPPPPPERETQPPAAAPPPSPSPSPAAFAPASRSPSPAAPAPESEPESEPEPEPAAKKKVVSWNVEAAAAPAKARRAKVYDGKRRRSAFFGGGPAAARREAPAPAAPPPSPTPDPPTQYEHAQDAHPPPRPTKPAASSPLDFDSEPSRRFAGTEEESPWLPDARGGDGDGDDDDDDDEASYTDASLWSGLSAVVRDHGRLPKAKIVAKFMEARPSSGFTPKEIAARIGREATYDKGRRRWVLDRTRAPLEESDVSNLTTDGSPELDVVVVAESDDSEPPPPRSARKRLRRGSDRAAAPSPEDSSPDDDSPPPAPRRRRVVVVESSASSAEAPPPPRRSPRARPSQAEAPAPPPPEADDAPETEWEDSRCALDDDDDDDEDAEDSYDAAPAPSPPSPAAAPLAPPPPAPASRRRSVDDPWPKYPPTSPPDEETPARRPAGERGGSTATVPVVSTASTPAAPAPKRARVAAAAPTLLPAAVLDVTGFSELDRRLSGTTVLRNAIDISAAAWTGGKQRGGWQTLADATEHGTNEAARNVNRMAESVLMLLGYADDIEAAVVARAAA